MKSNYEGGKEGTYGKYGPVITDNGNWILDTRFDMSRHDPLAMEENINAITGVSRKWYFCSDMSFTPRLSCLLSKLKVLPPEKRLT